MTKKYAIKFAMMHGEYHYHKKFFPDGPDVGSKIIEYDSKAEAEEVARSMTPGDFQIVEYPDADDE